MTYGAIRSSVLTALFLAGFPVLAAQQQSVAVSQALRDTASVSTDKPADPPADAAKSKPTAAPAKQHKLGPLNVSVSWRLRTEAWDWFQPTTGDNTYAFTHSLLRVGFGQ